MSRLFYHVMQDNSGNLLFDVSGTMRLAGTSTIATIYGDDARTIILPNPMTNHPSFGSFKCYLAPGSYDFQMSKAGYTFETLSGLQGSGSMTNMDASDVNITGGDISLDGTLQVGGPVGLYNSVGIGGAAPLPSGHLGVAGVVGIGGIAPDETTELRIGHHRVSRWGIILRSIGAESGNEGIVFQNIAGTFVGNINYNATLTSYNTTSDARLKFNVVPLTGALDVIRALNPVSHRWRADDSHGVSLLAHEVQQVVDGVTTGGKDAVDEAGQIVPQMIDYSKLVPWLVSAVKELTQQVEMLQAQLAEANA